VKMHNDLEGVEINNIEDFYEDFSEGGWRGWIELTQNPANNPYGAYLIAETELSRRLAEAELLAQKDVDQGAGFISLKKCVEYEVLDSADCPWYDEDGNCVVQNTENKCLRYETQTPGRIIADQLAFNLGSIGSKHPELVKEAIPIMIDYIKKPIEVTKREPTRVEAKGVVIEMNLNPEAMLGVDQTQWLKDAYIDSLGMIAKGDKDLIAEYKSLFSSIAKKDKSEYSRKKAQTVLDLL